MRRTGRPRLDDRDETVQVCVSLPSKQYDELDRLARLERTSVPEVIRRAIKRTDDAQQK